VFRNVVLGQYYPVDSPIHRLDPRTKIVMAIIYIVVLFLVRGVPAYGVLTAFSVGAILLSRVPGRLVLRTLRPILFILAFTLVLHVFFTKGEPLFTLGPLTGSREGLVQGAFMASRLLLLISTTSLLTLTTSPIALTDGIEALLRPFKPLGIPAHELAMMMTIALRFIPTLLEEADKIMKAQMARGADFESGNIVKRAKGMVPLLVPLFVGAFRRADDLALAMEARCYRGGENRTRMKQLRLGLADYAALTAFSAIMASSILVGRLLL